jgi:hypothetical protein
MNPATLYHGHPGDRLCPVTRRVPRAVWTDHARPGLLNCCHECEALAIAPARPTPHADHHHHRAGAA